ncbi:hypothetical protein Tco_0731836 [Tanacetum coccineum]
MKNVGSKSRAARPPARRHTFYRAADSLAGRLGGRFGNQSIERDRLIGIGFVLDFVEFISFTFGDKEMILWFKRFSDLSYESRRDYGWFNNADSVVISVVNYLSVRDLGRFMNYLEEATDGEAMINSIQNGDHPLPVVAQVSLAGTAPNAPPTLKDPKFWTAEEKKNRKIDRLARSLFYSWGFQ